MSHTDGLLCNYRYYIGVLTVDTRNIIRGCSEMRLVENIASGARALGTT